MRPPRSRTWGRRGITPVIRVRGGGTGRVSVAGLACYRPGDRSRLIYRLHCYRGRKGETKAFTWTEYRDLLIAAHRQLPGGNVVLVWDNLNVHLGPELRDFTGAQAWLRVFRLPAYAPDLNPVENLPIGETCGKLVGGVHGECGLADPGHPIHRVNADHAADRRCVIDGGHQPVQFARTPGECRCVARQRAQGHRRLHARDRSSRQEFRRRPARRVRLIRQADPAGRHGLLHVHLDRVISQRGAAVPQYLLKKP